MGTQIDALPHNTDTCTTKKALKVFLQENGDVNGFCYACHTFVEHPYGENKNGQITGDDRPVKSQAQIDTEIAEVGGYQFLDIPSRKLRSATLEKFGARVSVSQKDGATPSEIYWPVTKQGKLTGYHVKILDKSCSPYNIGNTKDCDLLNWDNARKSGAYKLIITEGPEDMASVDRIFELYGDKPEFHPAIVSLPHGSASAKRSLTKHLQDIKSLFKEVILCFDDDDAGRLAVEKAMQVLPSAKSVTLPAKDANQCLMEGLGKQAYKALSFRAETPKNTKLVFGSQIHDSAKEPARYGELTWPFPKMNEALRGFRLGETSYIGAGVKMGKGEIRDELAAHFMKNHGQKIFMASPEQTNKKTYTLLAGKVVSKIFHDPKVVFDPVAFDKAGDILKEQLAMVNLYQHLGWETLKQDMLAAVEWGAKVHFIDPITNLTNGVNSGEANTMLQGIAQDVSSFAMDHNIAVVMFCHLKAHEGNISAEQRQTKYKQGRYIGLGNCPHERGGDVSSSQFAGSRAMMRSANLMIGLEGNKDPELEEGIRNRRTLSILEDREFGVSEKFELFWNKETGRFVEL